MCPVTGVFSDKNALLYCTRTCAVTLLLWLLVLHRYMCNLTSDQNSSFQIDFNGFLMRFSLFLVFLISWKRKIDEKVALKPPWCEFDSLYSVVTHPFRWQNFQKKPHAKIFFSVNPKPEKWSKYRYSSVFLTTWAEKHENLTHKREKKSSKACIQSLHASGYFLTSRKRRI